MLQSGYYTVVITDENGCVSSTTTYVLIVGMEEVNSDNGFLIYPNPSNGNFILESRNDQTEGELKIEIRNTLGQTVSSAIIHTTSANWKKEIDLCNKAMHCISAGVYFVKISTSAPSDNSVTGLINKKLVVVK